MMEQVDTISDQIFSDVVNGMNYEQLREITQVMHDALQQV